MNTVDILRVELCFSVLDENSKGNCISTQQGPYSTYEPNKSTSNGYNGLWLSGSTFNNPEPHEDGLENRFSVIYGFKDLAQLYTWFEADILSLNEAGFKVSTYRVPEENVEYGRRQVQYQPCEAELVSIESIREAIHDVYFTDEFQDAVINYMRNTNRATD